MRRTVQSVIHYAESVTHPPKSTNHEHYQNVSRAVGAMPKSYPAGYSGYVHSHTRAQLLYARSGVLKFTTSCESWIIPPQRAVWIPARYPHKTGTVTPVEMRTLYIRANACPPTFPAEPRQIHVSSLLRELILCATDMPVEYDENGRDGKIVNLIFDEIEWSRTPVLKMPVLHDPRLVRIQQEFAANPGNPQTLQELALKAEVSCRTLARLFRQETGASFRTWRHQMRILAALPRLATGDSVTGIALDLGYETPGAFAAMFRGLMGAPPSRYFADIAR